VGAYPDGEEEEEALGSSDLEVEGDHTPFPPRRNAVAAGRGVDSRVGEVHEDANSRDRGVASVVVADSKIPLLAEDREKESKEGGQSLPSKSHRSRFRTRVEDRRKRTHAMAEWQVDRVEDGTKIRLHDCRNCHVLPKQASR